MSRATRMLEELMEREQSNLPFFRGILLARLQRLDNIKLQLAALFTPDPLIVKLVGRGLFATYRECVDAGIGTEACTILKI